MPSSGGFERLTAYGEAGDLLRGLCSPHERVSEVSPASARGRVVARAVDAPRPVPHHDCVAMDGIAVRASDTFDASGRSPVLLTEGTPPVAPDEGVPVHTGDPIPDGADAVVRIEDVKRRPEGLAVFESVAVGANVTTAGADVETGERLVEAGDRLAPVDLALVRATGIEHLAVYERPRVSVVPAGDGLVATSPAAGERIETNGSMVASLVEQWGAESTLREAVPAERDALVAAVESTLDHDLLVTTGSTSAGERDILPAVVEDLGRVAVHGVSLEPGHPLAVGVVSETPVVMLPGYPVSCYVDAVQFLRPAIAAIAGTAPRPFPTVRARLDGKLPSEPGTRTFARVRLDSEETASDTPEEADGDSSRGAGDTPRAVPLQVAGANRLSSVTAADGWVEIPEHLEGLPAGEAVSVQQWDWVWRA